MNKIIKLFKSLFKKEKVQVNGPVLVEEPVVVPKVEEQKAETPEVKPVVKKKKSGRPRKKKVEQK